MLLTVNIGNAHITLGGYAEHTVLFVAQFLTERHRTQDQYAVEIGNLMRLYSASPGEVDGAIIASVVPEITASLAGAIEMLTGILPIVLGPGVKTGLNILIENPAQLGADLVAGAVAAASLFPSPCIIFELDTVTTASVLNKRGDFVGAVIAAGAGINLDALTNHTALLPHVSIETPSFVIGKNSIHSMQSGLVYGTAAMLDGLAARIESEIGCEATLIATGELAPLIAPHCTRPVKVCKHLILEGLRLIYEKNQVIK